MSSIDSDFGPLTDDDRQLFDSYKDAILVRIQETFPTVPTNVDLKPLSLRRQLGCGTFYTFKVVLSDDEIVEVAFHLGGKRAQPLVGPPHFEITKTS